MNADRAVGLLAGAALDAVFADPRRGHPVAAYGRLATAVERAVYRDHRAAGVLHAVVLVGVPVAAAAVVEARAGRRPLWRAVVTAGATWLALGGASLAIEGASLARELGAGDLTAARRRLPHLCGRDPAVLGRDGLTRAGVESVAENTVDAVVAPLCWGAVAGVPGLIGYRAVNTLDAMVGYRNARYRHFGWAAARLDDVANLVPARLTAALTVLCAPLVGGCRPDALRVWRSDPAGHPSPNAGQVEAAFAGALRVRLGGRTVYAHGAQQRPVLGDGRSPGVVDLTRAVELSRIVGVAATAVSALVAMMAGTHRVRWSPGGLRRAARRIRGRGATKR